MDQETAITDIEKSIEAVIDIQWELSSYNTLSNDVRDALTAIGSYYFDILYRADPDRAEILVARLAEKNAQRGA